jgi:ferredoxin
MPPKIILDFTAKLKKSESQKLAFVFSTYTSYPLDANSYLIEKLQEKGYFVIAQENFKGPGASGYFYSNPNYPLVKERSIFRKGINQQMDHFINELIYSDKNNLKKMPVRYHYLNKLHQNFSRLTLGNLFYKNLKKNHNCINCGQCARSCPDSNLIMQEGTLIIKKSNGCMRCLRCVQICNKKAINFTSSKRTGNYSRKDIENAYHKATS